MHHFKLTLCLILVYTLCFGQNEPVLIKDINTPQPILGAMSVFARDNKIYFSDGTALGTGVAYESPAGAELTTLGSIYPGSVAGHVFFIEKTDGITKILRCNLPTVDTVSTIKAPSGITFPLLLNERRCFFIVNGTECWTAGADSPARLLKIFDRPVKQFNYPYLLTENGFYRVSQDEITILREGFAKTGDLSGAGFFGADSDGNGSMEVWGIFSGQLMRLFGDIEPGNSSSNPRHFFINRTELWPVFTANRAGQQHIFKLDFGRITPLVSAPAGAELQAINIYQRSTSGTQYLVFLLTQGGVSSLCETRLIDGGEYREIVRFTEGTVSHILTGDPIVLTHTLSNGRSNIWVHNHNDGAMRLVIENASTRDMMPGGVYAVADKSGKLWQLSRSPTLIASFLPPKLIYDFGEDTNPVVVTQLSENRFSPSTGRYPFLVFTRPASQGLKIWVASTAIGAKDIADIVIPSYYFDSDPRKFYKVGDRAVFMALNTQLGREVWHTDGTPDGTRLLGDLVPGSIDNGIYCSYQEGNVLYYTPTTNYGPFAVNRSIWRTDGRTIEAVPLGTSEYALADRFLCNESKKIGFTAFDGVRYEAIRTSPDRDDRGRPRLDTIELRRITQGDTTVLLAFYFRYGPNYYYPGPPMITRLQPLRNRFYFSFFRNLNSDMTNDGPGGALWVSNGTASGTRMVKKFAQRPSDPFVANGKLYFGANDGVNGTQLWESDGTEAGTQPILGIPPLDTIDGERIIEGIDRHGDNLYFLVHNQLPFRGLLSTEVWGYQLKGGLSTVKLATSPAIVSVPFNSIFLKNQLLMSYDQPSTGRELYSLKLPEIPVGGVVAAECDLSITQKIDFQDTGDSLTINITLNIQNNGPQTATDVVVTPANYGRSEYPMQNVTLSDSRLIRLPFSLTQVWRTATLAIGQSAQLRYTLQVPRKTGQVSVLRSTVKCRETDLFTANNIAETTVGQAVVTPEPSIAEKYIKLQPNPATDHLLLTLNVSENQTLRLSIVDVNGQIMWTSKQSVQQGEQEIPIETGNLRGGVYILQVFDEQGLYGAKQFLKMD